MIIGLAGKKQVGKTTAAKFLLARGFQPMSFAGPMKSIVSLLLMEAGVSVSEVEFYMDNKEQNIPGLDVSMRHILQTLGTDWGRNLIHPDLWVKICKLRFDKAINNGSSILFEDVRFENEAAFIRDNGGKIIHINRDTGFNDAHFSEAGIQIFDDDGYVANNCDMQTFLKRIANEAGSVYVAAG